MPNEPNPLYCSCRWCRWFNTKAGVCLNDRAFSDGDDIDFTPFYEDGHLAGAIREGFNEIKFIDLEHALTESRLSKKRISEIMKTFHNELDDAFINWTESIDECVSSALNHFEFGYTGGVKIKAPNEFHCRFFS